MARHLKSNPHRLLCEMLRQARMRSGVTQVALAKKLRRPQSWVSDIESANRRIDLIEFLKYAEAVGADPHDLIREFRCEREYKQAD